MHVYRFVDIPYSPLTINMNIKYILIGVLCFILIFLFIKYTINKICIKH